MDALMMNYIVGFKFWPMRFIVRHRVDWTRMDSPLTVRHPANFQTTARQVRIRVRRWNFICRQKLPECLMRTQTFIVSRSILVMGRKLPVQRIQRINRILMYSHFQMSF